MKSLSLKNLFHELRRREVFKTAALYIVGAWVVLQVAELALPALEIPDVAIRYVWIGAILLFPLVLVFGWRYDLSTSGIRRTLPDEAAEEDRALHAGDYWYIGSLASVAVAVTVVAGIEISRVEHEREFAAPANSIAVMPFEVCEGAPLDLLLARGLADEVINRLAERGKLKVIARASVNAFAGFGLSIPEIAKPLGVEYVLKGVVCRDGTTPTLTAELSDEQGFIVWSGSFTQQVNEFEQITSRLASQVADSVAAELGDVLVLQADPPVNSRAYEQLLIGRQHQRKGNRDEAQAALEKALEIDPDYAAAVLELARLQRTFDWSGVKGGEGLEEARALAEEALVLARRELEQYPQSVQANFDYCDVLSAWAYWDRHLLWREKAELTEREFEDRKDEIDAMFAESERHLRTAMSLNPSRIEFYLELAWLLGQQGRERRAEALEVLERGLEIDPLNVTINGRVANAWRSLGRHRQAVELLDRLKKLPDPPPGAWSWQLGMMFQEYWEEGIEILIDLLVNHPEHASTVKWWAWYSIKGLASLGLREEAEAWYVRLEKMEMTGGMHKFGYHNYLICTGRGHQSHDELLAEVNAMSNEEVLNAFQEWAGWYAETLAIDGQYDRAIELVESVRHAPQFRPELDVEPLVLSASIYAAAGREEEATPLLQEALDYLEAEYDAGNRHPMNLGVLAQIYAYQGRDEEALAMLRKAVDYHDRWTFINFELYPRVWLRLWNPWKRFRDDPRYIAQMDRVRADLEQEAKRVRAMLAQHDVDELLAPLMALAPEPEEASEQ